MDRAAGAPQGPNVPLDFVFLGPLVEFQHRQHESEQLEEPDQGLGILGGGDGTLQEVDSRGKGIEPSSPSLISKTMFD